MISDVQEKRMNYVQDKIISDVQEKRINYVQDKMISNVQDKRLGESSCVIQTSSTVFNEGFPMTFAK